VLIAQPRPFAILPFCFFALSACISFFKVRLHLDKAGYQVRSNDPISGRDGHIFAIDQCSTSPPYAMNEPGTKLALGISFRSDLAQQEMWRLQVQERLLEVLDENRLL